MTDYKIRTYRYRHTTHYLYRCLKADITRQVELTHSVLQRKFMVIALKNEFAGLHPETVTKAIAGALGNLVIFPASKLQERVGMYPNPVQRHLATEILKRLPYHAKVVNVWVVPPKEIPREEAINSRNPNIHHVAIITTVGMKLPLNVWIKTN